MGQNRGQQQADPFEREARTPNGDQRRAESGERDYLDPAPCDVFES